MGQLDPAAGLARDGRPPRRAVDLSGFMFSGKSAVSDLLRECDRVLVPNYRTEFDLLRIGGGLIDLENAVVDWSPIRTQSALTRFERTVQRLAATPAFPANLVTTGFGYARQYPGILEGARRFVDEIVDVAWSTPWPFDDLDDGPVATFTRKLRSRFGAAPRRSYRLVSAERFPGAASAFVSSLLWQGADPSRYDLVVTHNALEPFDPARHLHLLGPGARSIVVDRDPRDIYATAITTQVGFNDDLEFYRRIAGAHDVETFIRRHQAYRRACAPANDRVLRLRFEDVALRYDETVARVLEFLELPSTAHVARGSHLDPERTRANIGIWRAPALAAYAADFARIEAECGA